MYQTRFESIPAGALCCSCDFFVVDANLIQLKLHKLTTCLEDHYRFKVQHQTLDESDNPQIDLNYIILTFVKENQSPHNLCLIYYAGHGWGDESPGRLYLTRRV